MNDSQIPQPFLLALLAVVVPNLRPREGINWCETATGIRLWLDAEGPITVSLTLRYEQLIADPISLGIQVAEELLRCLNKPGDSPCGLGLEVRTEVDADPLPRIRPCRSTSGTRFPAPVPGRMEPESAP